MAYVLSNGSVIAQTAYTDAGLTIGTGTTALGGGHISGRFETFWVGNATPTVIYAFPNQTDTAGLYLYSIRATNEDVSISTIPSYHTGTFVKVTPNTTYSNIFFGLWTGLYISMGRSTTTVTNDTLTFTSTAPDGERAYQFSMIKVI